MQIVVFLCDTPRPEGRCFTGRTSKKTDRNKSVFSDASENMLEEKDL